MGLILRSLVTCLFVTYTLGVEFRYPDNNTCIMAQMNVSFTLSDDKELHYLSGPQLDDAESSCSSKSTTSVLALSWVNLKQNFNDTMTFTFMLNRGKVEMRVEYKFIPLLHFNDSKDSNLTILKSPTNFELSMSNMSYKCDSSQEIILKNGKYQLVMSFAEVQVQAFGVENDTFSNFEECDLDTKTTVQTTIPLSTTLKPPSLYLYEYAEKGSKNACILLQAAIQLDINYMDTKKSVTSAKVNVPNPLQVNVTGHCAKSDTGNASITLNWFNGESRFSMKMDFIADMGYAKLDMIEVDAELFRQDYPDLHDNSTDVMSMRDVDFSSLNDTYYKCSSLQETELDNITTVVIYKIQVQAFGVKNSNFTGYGTDCSQETTTTKTTPSSTTGTTHTANMTTGTTPTAEPTTSATPHPSNNYSVSHNNVTCVFFMAGMDFIFKYTMKNGTNTSILVSVPPTFTVNGSCETQNSTTNELNIYFNMDWSLKFVFGYDNISSLLGDSTLNVYSIHSIELDYTVDSSHFPGYDVNGSAHYTAMANITSPLFQSKVNGSYKCNAQTEVPFIWNNMTVTLETFNLQYKAFNKDNNTAFGGDLRECSADNSNDNNKTNSVVPIAVGAALAGLVVIVLIAYLIGRRRNRKGYESV